MFSSRLSLQSILLATGFVLLCGIYYIWGWSHVLADFGGDNAYYLLIAKHFSPWSAHSDVATYFAIHSHFPPLYPLVLAIFGGGESLLVAHLVTVSCLLLALVVFYAWLRLLDVPVLVAGLLIFLFALMFGTYMQALYVLSENLYLFLTLACLMAVAAYERYKQLVWLWIAAASLAAAILTRSAGVSLLAAFVLYLLLYRPPRFWLFIIVVVLPIVTWNLFSSQEVPGYLSALMDKYKNNPVAILTQQLAVEGHVLWYGWIRSFTGSDAALPLLGILGVLCLSGAGYRLYLRKMDGLYAAAYLLLVMLWPFPAETQRLLFVIMPVLLTQGVLLLKLLPKPQITRCEIRYEHFLYLAILLVILPDLFLTGARFMAPLPKELVEYRRMSRWYYIEPDEARASIIMSAALAKHMKSLQSIIPEKDCIYAIKPSVVGYYSGRISVIPPRPDFNDAALDAYLKKSDCRYFYMMSIFSPSFPEPYYPLERLHESLMVISATPEKNQVGPVGMLAVIKKR